MLLVDGIFLRHECVIEIIEEKQVMLMVLES